MQDIGLILLAAGASTRLGKPKQELPYKGMTLLQHAAQAALDSDCVPVVVVLGAESTVALPEVTGKPLAKVYNPEWEEGMASSIRYGLTELLAKEPAVSGAVIMVCDQPYVDAPLLNSLCRTKLDTGKGIVACSYNYTLGTPVLFDKAFFQELLELIGHEGAKKLLYRHKDQVASIPFPLGAIDIDTAEEYAALLDSQSGD
jgi:molybdenum cofactor cytidylyltransferase